jgi:hypothetical protein
MSKERELIKDMKILLECTYIGGLQRNADVLIGRAIELLAQPETEQEPVAWMNDSGGCFLSDGNKYSENWTALYTSPPRRKPLSDEEIFEIGYKAGFAIDQDESADYESDAYGFLNEDGYVDNEPYFKLVRAIEKAHGIGQ